MPGALLPPAESLKKLEPGFNKGKPPRACFFDINLHGTITFPSPTGEHLRCAIDIALQRTDAVIQWSAPLPSIRVKYYTDEKDYVRNGVTLQFRDVDSKQVVYFEHNISDIVFHQRMFVGTEFAANKIEYINAAISSENMATIAVTRQLSLKVKAQPTNTCGKSFECLDDNEIFDRQHRLFASLTPQLVCCSYINP